MQHSGISSEFIKEALCHDDPRTKENYLDSFELEIKKKYSNSLTTFKEIKEKQVREVVCGINIGFVRKRADKGIYKSLKKIHSNCGIADPTIQIVALLIPQLLEFFY